MIMALFKPGICVLVFLVEVEWTRSGDLSASATTPSECGREFRLSQP
jgi:hypothetical protein